jgi:hypothetical protein
LMATGTPPSERVVSKAVRYRKRPPTSDRFRFLKHCRGRRIFRCQGTEDDNLSEFDGVGCVVAVGRQSLSKCIRFSFHFSIVAFLM